MLKIIKYSFLFISILFIILLYSIGGGFGKNTNLNFIQNNPALIFSHRGVTKGIVENSIEAFDNSLKVGFTAIETDINFTKDKHLVIFHDFTGKRLLGIDKKISELAMDEIQSKHLMYNNLPTINKVISLKEFIIRYKDSTTFYLDIKDINIPVADSLIKYIKTYKIERTTLIADTNLLFLAYLKIFKKDIITVLEDYESKKMWFYHFIPKDLKPNYCAGRLSEISSEYIKFLKENNYFKEMIVYGINSQNINQVKKLGFHSVIIDYDSALMNYDSIQHILD